MYREDAKAATKPNAVSNPTYRKAIKALEEYDKQFDLLLSEIERLNLEIRAAREKTNRCFEEGDITVKEYEVIFYYYFEGMSNEEVAESTYYSVDYIYELKRKAISGIKIISTQIC